jgi:hypothetical protein
MRTQPGERFLFPQLSEAAGGRLHYLGNARRVSLEYADEFGFITFSNPTSRRLPQDWLELNRWILLGKKNGGSQQWRRAVQWIRRQAPRCTTVISYSDPAVGHSGALYRACNFVTAPTWLRLVPPPTGNGTRSGRPHSVKDRWVYPLLRDERRVAVLSLAPAYAARFPGRSYVADWPLWGRSVTRETRTGVAAGPIYTTVQMTAAR